MNKLRTKMIIAMLEKEAKTFEQKLPELLKADMGKFALIKEDQIVGVFSAIADALSYGYEKYNDQPFFVRQVLPTQQPLNFVNNYLFE
jgi:hypothetical protein